MGMNHNPGEILSSPEIHNAWIDPRGRMHFVPYYSHRNVAETILESSAEELEEAGWLHLSLADPGYIIPPMRKPTYAQIETIWDLRLLAEFNLANSNGMGNSESLRMARATIEFLTLNGE